MEFILYILAGAGVGFAIGLTGVGGGSLMTPLLLVFGFPPNIAVGTDLLYASITKSGGVFMHRRQGTIRWRIVFALGSASIPASLVTIWVLKTYFSDGGMDYTSILTSSLGVMLIITSIVILFKKKLVSGSLENTRLVKATRKHAYLWTFVMGLVLGVFVTLSSVGAGAFGTAVLLVLFPRMPAIHIVGTDLAHAVPLTLVAGMGHLFLGNVDFVLLFSLIAGSLPAIYVGTRLATRLPDNILQPVMASVLLILGVRYAFF